MNIKLQYFHPRENFIKSVIDLSVDGTGPKKKKKKGKFLEILKINFKF